MAPVRRRLAYRGDAPRDGGRLTAETRTAIRTCPLCEATCGLELTLEGRTLTKVRGDAADVFSAGYLCPKAFALQDLENDPDVVRTPLVREGGELREATWEEAFARVEAGLAPLIREAGPDAVAVYLGNPNVHNLAGLLYARVMLRALRTANLYSATSVDQMPKQVSAAYMFGTGLSIPIPDVDRTDHMLILGANPLVSNGSLFTAPDLPGPAPGAAGPGRQGRRGRPAQDRDRPACRRAPRDPARAPTPTCCSRSSHVLFAEGLSTPGRLEAHTSGSTTSARWPSRSRPRPSRR